MAGVKAATAVRPLLAVLALGLAAATGCADDTPTPGSGPDGSAGDAGDRDGGPAGQVDGEVPADGSSSDAGASIAAPTGLDAYPAKAAVGLDWDPVDGAESYNVYWSTEPGATPVTAMILPDVVPGHVHRGLEDGTTYHYVVTAVVGGFEGPASEEVSATPGGELVLHTLGTGRIEAIASDERAMLPMDARVHVLLLAEGYLEGELATFETDIDNWHDEVFALDPYRHLREAFVVWYLPRASAEHVAPGSPQPADTAFRVPLTESGSGVGSVPSDGITATRVWEVLEELDYRSGHFYPSGGRTSLRAKGTVVHILIYDAARGRSGLSGRAVRLRNPAAVTQAVGVAIAHGRAHEISHALARVSDEYLDVDITGIGVPNEHADRSSGVNNVVAENQCDTLPWQHLLVGGAINPDVDQLVGAFGTSDIGYHPEFKCQMNGSHDNGMFYGGENNLRVGRFCNFCRELITFRVLEHTRTLPDPSSSWATWVADYRAPFYDRYGFSVPDTVPQENSLGEPRWQDCAH